MVVVVVGGGRVIGLGDGVVGVVIVVVVTVVSVVIVAPIMISFFFL